MLHLKLSDCMRFSRSWVSSVTPVYFFNNERALQQTLSACNSSERANVWHCSPVDVKQHRFCCHISLAANPSKPCWYRYFCFVLGSFFGVLCSWNFQFVLLRILTKPKGLRMDFPELHSIHCGCFRPCKANAMNSFIWKHNRLILLLIFWLSWW